MSLKLRVLTLNCWGIPLVSSNRRCRIRAIGEFLAQESDCDVVCLQEVWTLSDYESIKNAASVRLPFGHYFQSGVVGSGVCILSKYEILEVHFHAWPINGYIHKIHHGDWWAGKGVCLIRIQISNLRINIYSTHLHAEYSREHDEYLAHRILQAYDTAQFIRLTSETSHAVILAGDLNTEPHDLAYRLLTTSSNLNDACPNDFYTHESPSNSYTPIKNTPKRIDYVLWGGASVKSASYTKPLPNRIIGTQFSYSDHDGIQAELELTPNSPKSTCTSDIAALKEALTVLEDASLTLDSHQRMYGLSCLVLLAALLAWPPWDAAPGFVVHLVRLALCALLVFTVAMATAWNRIEQNAVNATRSSMLFQVKLNS